MIIPYINLIYNIWLLTLQFIAKPTFQNTEEPVTALRSELSEERLQANGASRRLGLHRGEEQLDRQLGRQRLPRDGPEHEQPEPEGQHQQADSRRIKQHSNASYYKYGATIKKRNQEAHLLPDQRSPNHWEHFKVRLLWARSFTKQQAPEASLRARLHPEHEQREPTARWQSKEPEKLLSRQHNVRS